MTEYVIRRLTLSLVAMFGVVTIVYSGRESPIAGGPFSGCWSIAGEELDAMDPRFTDRGRGAG